MRLTIIFMVAIAALAAPAAMTQQAGENINVLPVVFPQDDPDHWFVKGDGFLQRQVEPTIAASTRNPDHLLAFFVDYRAVDIANDIGLGQAEAVMAMFNHSRTMMMAAFRISLPELPNLDRPPIAAAEAWVGMSRSYDGGITWSGGFLPGAPFDISPASLAAPIHGLEAATDPVLAAGPCGKFYLVFMAFDRGDQSKLVVARYQDNNYAGGGEHISYEGMTVIETGNNATYGYFLDKPDIEVDIFRDSNPDICADRVYVTYSTFNGFDPNGKFTSKVNFAYSVDGGLSFTTQKVNPPYTRNQGSAIAVDPADGTVYALWRHFGDPDAILMASSTNFGVKFTKPSEVTDTVPMAAFDQPGISISDAFAAGATSPVNPGFPEVAFRSNGFPTAVVTGDGTLFAAWQERVDANGRPSVTGTPRIVVVRSTNGGGTWTDVNGAPDRLAVDMGWRDLPGDPNVPAPGFGALPRTRLAGPQVQPKLVFSGGQLLLAYYESGGRIANYGYPSPGDETIVPADLGPATGFISGYDRLLDFRAALLDPQTGAMSSTIQVSRYPIRGDADLVLNGEDLMDVAPVQLPCFPDSGNPADPVCVRQVNRANAVQSASGTTPFIGDYPDAAAIVQFIYDQQQGRWRWATEATDLPYPGFHTIFTDNRHLIPPPGPAEWNGYQFYDPPFESPPDNLPGCVNAGSRNTDVLTSRIDTSLVLNAPTVYKQLDNQRSFPFSVSNRTGESRVYRLEIVAGMGGASFNRFDDSVHSGDVEIFGYSSGSFLVYINTGYPDPVRVEVSEICPPPPGFDYTCSNTTGVLTFNLESGYSQVPAVDGPDTQLPEVEGDPFFVVTGGDPSNPFVINPFVINPFVINPFVINPFVINPFVINPFVINPFVINPFVINTNPEDIEAVIDTTWTISPGASNTASSYLPVVNIDNASAFIDAGYVFQLIVYKGSLYGGVDGCEAVNVGQPQILANVTQDPGAENPFVINPFVINPFVINPFVINPFVINSSFTMAPADNPTVPDDGTTKADPAGDEIKITLRAFKLPPRTGTLLKTTDLVEYKPWEDPPSLVIVPQPCADTDPASICRILSLSPDLVPYLPALDVGSPDYVPDYSVTAAAGGTLIDFPVGGWTLSNEGLPGQTFGDATAENGDLRHGFYVCESGFVDGHPDDEPLDVGDPACTPTPEFLTSVSNTLELWADEAFVPVDLSVPLVQPGDYYLVLYADDTVQVSERNEINNAVTVPLTITNPPPVAQDLTFEVAEDGVLTGNLDASDPTGETLTYSITTGVAHGTLTLDDPVTGAFTYTPDPDYNGTDGFEYVASDGSNDSNVATVAITVTPVNDPPILGSNTFTVAENSTLQGVLDATDVDLGDVLVYSATTPPSHGTLELDQGGSFSYTPDLDFIGEDGFEFSVTDGTVTVIGSATVTVFDPVPDWLFIGFDNPWRPFYTVQSGSAIPLKWYYSDPASGSKIDSFVDNLEITATGYTECDSAGNPVGAPIAVLSLPEDAGSSDLRYVSGDWQLNWDTVDLPVGCYFMSIHHPTTNQTDTRNANGEILTIVLR
jgi:hypothetical protein